MQIDRMVQPPKDFSEESYWYIFRGGDLMISGDQVPMAKSAEEIELPLTNVEFLGFADKKGYYTAEILGEAEALEGYTFESLRGSYKNISLEQYRLAGYAFQIKSWSQNFAFCGKCGQPTVKMEHERAKKCPTCNILNFPRLSPAIIVAIKKDDKVLLAHNVHFRENLYSVIAGFVDAGESVEEALHREIMEEVGIKVNNVQYISSQSHPFPDSLMLGFTADYVSGEITPDKKEILEARWFGKDDLEQIEIPGKVAIARWVMEEVLGSL